MSGQLISLDELGREIAAADTVPKLKSLADKGAAIGAGEYVGLVIAVMLELHTLSPYTLKALADTLEGKVDDNEPVMIMD